jgi:hypothetical protein
MELIPPNLELLKLEIRSSSQTTRSGTGPVAEASSLQHFRLSLQRPENTDHRNTSVEYRKLFYEELP